RAETRRALKDGDQPTRLAALNLLADLGASVNSPETQPEKSATTQDIRRLRSQAAASEGLAPNLADMIVHGATREDRQAAAYALGQIAPDPKIAAPALGSLLSSKDARERRAAAGGLVGIVRVVSQLSSRGNKATTAPEIDRGVVVNVGSIVIPVAAR